VGDQLSSSVVTYITYILQPNNINSSNSQRAINVTTKQSELFETAVVVTSSDNKDLIILKYCTAFL